MEAKIRHLIKDAMIDKNENAKLTYKSILNNALKIAKDNNRPVNDDDFITSTKKEIKQLNDLLEYVKTSNVKSTEINEKINYCEKILPNMATEEQILDYLVSNNIDKNMGTCMKSLKIHFGSLLDNRVAQKIVKQYIGYIS